MNKKLQKKNQCTGFFNTNHLQDNWELSEIHSGYVYSANPELFDRPKFFHLMPSTLR